ncbi:iron-containing alcohol dehydrogenase family protein [Vineibacter terrae]|uniref:iron-containing alcohol dehydrogenase family protein n=1 Tax=Vineibacter terrae TaxID=2586908 RepID=UPI0015B6120D|nr:iron-containing alcohol dehydrogenase family protein [Vineibacter terrae]
MRATTNGVEMQLNFRANSHRCRIYSGDNALASLPAELTRSGIRRAAILCGNSVAKRTGLISALRDLLGESCAGVFDQAGRHATLESVQAAAALVRDVDGDGLIAVGAGSVMMSARLAAILLAERAPLHTLVTTYREDGPAVSPRLDAPKLPIFNVLTAPTNAQNRGGSAMRDPDGERRLEMFDPKTRPAAIFWDPQALRTAPPRLMKAAGLTVFWWSLMTLGGVASANPLSCADRRQSFDLALQALPRLTDEHDDEARIAMCAAAFLQNRDEDDGGQPFEVHWVFKVCYALASGIFTKDEGIDPGPVYVALTAPAIEHFAERNLAQLRSMCLALGNVTPLEASAATPERIARSVREFFAGVGETRRLRDLGVAREALPAIRDFALRNYNADRGRQLRGEVARLDETLGAAW